MARYARTLRVNSSFILHHSSFRSAFTLTELLVSLAILVGMMTMIATIFSTAGKASGTAQASSKLYRQIQQVSDTIRRDLAALDPVTGLMVISGVEFGARDTLRSKTEPHRADVLAFISQGAGKPFEPYIYQSGPGDNTTFSQAVQVVYGHANVGKLDGNGNWMPGSVRNVEVDGQTDSYPASQWHLARRVVGFAQPGSNRKGAGYAGPPMTWDQFTGAASGGLSDLNTPGIADVVYHENGLSGLLLPAPLNENMGQFYGMYKHRWNGTTYQMYDCCVDRPGKGQFRYVWMPNLYIFRLAQDGTNLFWWQYSAPDKYVRVVPGGPVPPQTIPPEPPPFLPHPMLSASAYCYNGAATRTQLDPMPPAGMSSRMGSYFLPGCAEFKVEFTYDDPREVPLYGLVGDPNVNYQPLVLIPDPDGDGVADNPVLPTRAPRPIRWQTVPKNEQWVWYRLPVENNVYGSVAPDDLRDRTFPFRWPRALRITIRAYAPGGALDYSVEQTIVHVF